MDPRTAARLRPGMRVDHRWFGPGRVTKIERDGRSGAKAEIACRDGFSRVVDLRYAPLTVTDQLPPEPPRKPIPESEAVASWRVILSPHFDIQEEVTGRHWTGRNHRIDMLLHPKFDWAGGGRTPIGFEVKRPAGGIKHHSRQIAQAVDYASTNWTGARRGGWTEPYFFIFVHCDVIEQLDNDAFYLRRILGQLGVGFIELDGWTGNVSINLSGSRMWSSNLGPAGGQWAARRKFGSR